MNILLSAQSKKELN